MKYVDVGLAEAARIAGQRMFEGGQREARFGHRPRIAPRQMGVEYPGGKGVTRADPVDDPGHRDLLGLDMVAPRIDPRRKPMARRRCSTGLATPPRVVARAAAQHRQAVHLTLRQRRLPPEVAARLRVEVPERLPVARVVAGCSARQQVHHARLEGLEQAARALLGQSPVLMIMGEVVNLGAELQALLNQTMERVA